MEEKGNGSKRIDSSRDIDSKLSNMHIAEAKNTSLSPVMSCNSLAKLVRDSAKEIDDDAEADEEFLRLMKKPNEGIYNYCYY